MWKQVGNGRVSSTRQKIDIMAIDVLTRMREAIGGARMKELGAWLGVNQSVLSDRI